MAWIKRTFVIPKELVRRFEVEVPKGERDAVIAKLIEEWLERRRRARLRHDVAEGCAAMADLYLEIEKEYHPLDEEVERRSEP